MLVVRVELAGLEAEVGPVKAGDQPEGVAQPQLVGDVLADPVGGGGGEGGHHRAAGQLVDKVPHQHVAGAEVPPPLADAVGLVHRHHADSLLPGKADKARHLQPLGRDVDDLVLPLGGAAEHQGLLAVGQAAVQVGGAHPHRHQRPHLVLHQADQRADHQSHPRQHQRRHLVAQRLARAGGHHRQHIPPRKDGPDDLSLPRAEAVVAKHPLQYAACIFHLFFPPFARFRACTGHSIAQSGPGGHISGALRMDFCPAAWYNDTDPCLMCSHPIVEK